MNPLTNVKNIQKLNQTELKAGGKKSWHDQYKDSAWVFIGGLPYDLTEGDILSVFSQYGEIVNLNLVRDEKTGKSKGYAFLCYEDQRSTILTVDNLNSIKLLGRIIRVDHVENYRKPKEKDEEDEITKKLRAEGCAPSIEVIKKEDDNDDEIPAKRVKKEKDSDNADKKAKKKKKKKEKKKRAYNTSSSDSEVETKSKQNIKQIVKQEKGDSGYDRAEFPEHHSHEHASRKTDSGYDKAEFPEHHSHGHASRKTDSGKDRKYQDNSRFTNPSEQKTQKFGNDRDHDGDYRRTNDGERERTYSRYQDKSNYEDDNRKTRTDDGYMRRDDRSGENRHRQRDREYDRKR